MTLLGPLPSSLPRGARAAINAGVDGLACFLAVIVAGLSRLDFVPAAANWSRLLTCAALVAVLAIAIGYCFSLYRGRYTIGGFEEVLGLSLALATTFGTTFVVLVLTRPEGVPRGMPVVAFPIALTLAGAARYLKRAAMERPRRCQDGAERVLVFGAGEVGAALVQRMLRDTDSRFLPAGFLDDDPHLRHLRVGGVRVLGGRSALAAAASMTGATGIVIAVGRADAPLIRQVADAATSAGLRCMVMPPLNSLITGGVRLAEVRDVDVYDVIGRHPVDTDISSIAHYLSGKRVLVTGAGGSIGSELARQIHAFGPAELVLLDRDESALHGVQLSIYGQGLLDSPSIELVDIRDPEALAATFDRHCPEVVFHAAALKHLPLLERYPREAWKSNVLGTLNVLQAAKNSGVNTFVNISTDKAANPISALGHSKRLAEQLTSWFSHRVDGTYLSVRFGNVLGSRGSVLHAFHAQIEAGDAVTVTDPDVTRFFMTIPEACQLVIQAGAIGRAGEALVLDMGQPVRILDVARRMIEWSGKPLDVVFTGLRPGEKLHEELLGHDELDARPFHPLVSHVAVPGVAPASLDEQPWARVVFGRDVAVPFGFVRHLESA